MTANLPRPSSDENISTTLSSGITDVAGSMDVADASKIVSPCYLVIDRVDSSGTLKDENLWEYVKVTNVASNTLTITRAQGGSTGQAHSSGAVVEAVVTSSFFEDWYNVLNPEHDSAGGHVIVGTMTVAGMNLASVATIASAGIGVNRVITHLNVSGASISGLFLDEDTMTSNSALLGATQQSIKAYVDTEVGGVASNTDGWTTSADTWTYASASTFTISGVDRTTTYTKGTRLKFTQTSVKYAVVVSSSFSTDTTVTIAVNTDYTIANAAITSPYYSYQASPQGYPGYFAYTPTGPTNTTLTGKYRIIGNELYGWINGAVTGSPDFTNMPTLPVAAASFTASTIFSPGTGGYVDAGTAARRDKIVPQIVNGATTVNLVNGESTSGDQAAVSATVPITWANTDAWYVCFTYQI